MTTVLKIPDLLDAGSLDQIGRLSDDQFFIESINERGSRLGWWRPDRIWTRMSGRFSPYQEIYATLVFQTQDEPQHICLIELSQHLQAPSSAEETTIFMNGMGWLRLTRFPEDPTLPMLRHVLMTSDQAHVVHYHPHHRCTIQFSTGPHGFAEFAKVFDSDVGQRIHTDGMALWDVANRGALGFSVPEPVGWDGSTRTLWQKTVPGTPVTIHQLLEAKGLPLAYKIGEAIATLHQCRLSSTIIFDNKTVLRQARRHSAMLTQHHPHLQADVEILLNHLQLAHARWNGQELVPLHTDLHPEQWLVSDSGLGLVDFDRMACGDREYDVASFLTELAFKDKGRGRFVEVQKAFIHGYESMAIALNPALIDIYCAHKWLAKALRATSKIHPNRALCAKQYVLHAQEYLFRSKSERQL